MIETEQKSFQDIAQLQTELEVPQEWHGQTGLGHITQARQMMTRQAIGKAHMLGSHNITKVIVEGKEVCLILECGAACSVVRAKFLRILLPNWEDKIIGYSDMKFGGCSESLKPVGVIETSIIFPHNQG